MCFIFRQCRCSSLRSCNRWADAHMPQKTLCISSQQSPISASEKKSPTAWELTQQLSTILATMVRITNKDMNNPTPNNLDQDHNSGDSSSLAESNDNSERDNVDDEDVFGSLLSWEDEEDLPTMSVCGNFNKRRSISFTRVGHVTTDGEDDGSGNSNRMRSQGNLTRSQMMDMMLGFASPALNSNEQLPNLVQQQQQPMNRNMDNMATQQTDNAVNERSTAISSMFANDSTAFDFPISFPGMQHQYSPLQNYFSMPQQGDISTQKNQKQMTSPPMANQSLGSLPQSIQHKPLPQAFHLPSRIINVHGTQVQGTQPEQQQQTLNSPAVGPNSSLGPLQMQGMRPHQQLPNRILQLPPAQQDQQKTENDPLSLLPQLMQQNPVLTVMLPGQNPVTVSQQDMWTIFQQQMQQQQRIPEFQQQMKQQQQQQIPELPQWLIPSMQQRPQQSSIISSSAGLAANDGAQQAVGAVFDGSCMLPAQQDSIPQQQLHSAPFPSQLCQQSDNGTTFSSNETSLARPSSQKESALKTVSSGRSVRGRGRFRSKTLLPLISDLTGDSVSSITNYSSNGGGNPKLTLSKANAVAEASPEENATESSVLPRETPSCSSALPGVKSSLPQSKAGSAGASTSHRRKATSLAQEATLAMNVAKEEEQKEKRISQQKEQLKQSTVNLANAQPTFSIVSNDELSDTSFLKPAPPASCPPCVQNHSNLNLMCPPPPANATAMNVSMNYLNDTWNVMKSTSNAAASDPVAVLPPPEKVEKRSSKSRKRSPTVPLPNSNVSDHKRRFSLSSLQDSTSETDGGFTDSVEKDSKLLINESELSEGDRNRLNRDRNREHARNTRLRKKAYVEKLRATVEDLCRERDSLVQDRATSASRLLEQQKLRIDVLLGYFALRRQCERRRDLWAGLCEESVVCTLPITPYRSFPAFEVQASKLQRTIQGIDSLMADAISFHILLDSMIDYSTVFNPRSPYYALHAVHAAASQAIKKGSQENVSSPPLLISSASPKIQVQYTLITEDACPGGSQVMARWTMVTLNAVALGAPCELTNNCMLCAKFSTANKIISLDHVFDGLAFMLQLKPKISNNSGFLSSTVSTETLTSDPLASASGFKVIPNTVQVAQRYYDVPMVLTSSERPYTIMQVNSLWEDMTGYKAEAVVGKTNARILQPCWQQISNASAPYQDPSLSFLMMEVRLKRPATATLINVNASGELFRNVLQVFPLSTDGKITHYLGLTIFKQTLGINWNTVLQNPMMFQQTVHPHVSISSGASTATECIGSIRQGGGLRIGTNERDAENSSGCEAAKISDGGSL